MSQTERVNSYRDLIVWQRGMDIAASVYQMTESYPKDQLYGLRNQMQRAAVSIPSNIAEGHERDSTKEYLHFISISLGSLAELETQILLSERLNYLKPEDAKQLLALADEIGRMLRAIQRRLKAKL
jgi:four helix bundle protein